MGGRSNMHLKKSRAADICSTSAYPVFNLVEACRVVGKIDEIVPVVEFDIQKVQHGKAQCPRNFDSHVVAHVAEVECHQVATPLLESSERQQEFPRGIDGLNLPA